MKERTIVKTIAWLMIFVMLIGFAGILSPIASAADGSVSVDGQVYTFDEKAHYEYSSSESSDAAHPGENTYGSFSLLGTLTSDGSKDGFPSFMASGGTVKLVYSYKDTYMTADEESWHLVEDKSKKVDIITLPENIKYGALILQTSKDGKSWFTDLMQTNVFETTPTQTEAFYSANSLQLANGCYYRLVIVYKSAIKVGQNKFLFISSDDVEYKKTAEVYEFYLHDNSASSQDTTVMSRSLGRLTNTGKDNGYSEDNVIGIKDPHYGWEIGRFFVSGYTRETKDDSGNPVFLKNVGDQVTLWFNLGQDIDKLNGDSTLSINEDVNGYDQYFQTGKTNMGRGTLIIRYTDEHGVKHDPEIYTDYLLANASTSADTIVKLFEEGDYEVALDYEIKSTPRKVGSFEVVPEYYNYRIFFTFSVRNGNCMVFPFDISTGDELGNEAITPNGFKLDMARSRYLTIDVKRSVVTEGPNGYAEDVRFNRPARDGDSYTEPGIYVFSVKNLYTNETTTKTIYVGSVGYMNALSVNRISVAELNALVDQGAIINDDGSITMPTPSPVPTQEAVSTEVATETVVEASTSTPTAQNSTEQPSHSPVDSGETVTREEPESRSRSGMTIPIIIGSVVVVAVVYALLSKKKKTVKEGQDK